MQAVAVAALIPAPEALAVLAVVALAVEHQAAQARLARPILVAVAVAEAVQALALAQQAAPAS